MVQFCTLISATEKNQHKMKTTKIPFFDAVLIEDGENVIIRANVGSAFHVIDGPRKGEKNVDFLEDLYRVVETLRLNSK